MFTCALCREDHIACGEGYESHRLTSLAPLVGPRSGVAAAVTKDPYFAAVLDAWREAASKGLIRWRPLVERQQGGLRPLRLRSGAELLVGDSLAFPVQITRAGKYARQCEELALMLRRRIDQVEEGAGQPRYRAIAELTRMMFLLTRLNLLHFIAFCKEVGPQWTNLNPDAWASPEVPPLRTDYVYGRVHWWSESLCHGLSGYRYAGLPGGREFEGELVAFEKEYERFLARYAHTPFAWHLRRRAVCRFSLHGEFRQRLPRPRWVPAEAAEPVTTEPARPARAGPGGSSSGGASSSGGR